MSKTVLHVLLLVESTLYVSTVGSGSKGVLVEQDSEVCVASTHKELIRDVRNMITGFLKNNRMKLTTGSGDNVSRIPARRTWIPLKESKSILMMHEITVSCINVTKPFRFGLTRID